MILKLIMFVVILFLLSLLIISFFMLSVRKTFNIINEISPNIDEIKEILNGNRAVSDYFSRIISSVIISIGMIISAIMLIAYLVINK